MFFIQSSCLSTAYSLWCAPVALLSMGEHLEEVAFVFLFFSPFSPFYSDKSSKQNSNIPK